MVALSLCENLATGTLIGLSPHLEIVYLLPMSENVWLGYA